MSTFNGIEPPNHSSTRLWYLIMKFKKTNRVRNIFFFMLLQRGRRRLTVDLLPITLSFTEVPAAHQTMPCKNQKAQLDVPLHSLMVFL